MGVDVFLAGIDVLGVGVAVVVTAHLLGVVHHHLVVQVLDLVGGMDIVQLLDIKIAQPECLFQLHAVLAAHPGHHGRGDHEMIFQVGDGVPGQNANPFCIHKTALLAIFADSIHIAVGHGTVEQKTPRWVHGAPSHRCHRWPRLQAIHLCSSLPHLLEPLLAVLLKIPRSWNLIMVKYTITQQRKLLKFLKIDLIAES